MRQETITRLCPHCQTPITRADELAGACPLCQGRLWSLAGDPTIYHDIEALGYPLTAAAMRQRAEAEGGDQ